jgi:hypothetical protein
MGTILFLFSGLNIVELPHHAGGMPKLVEKSQICPDPLVFSPCSSTPYLFLMRGGIKIKPPKMGKYLRLLIYRHVVKQKL